jgi:glycosyltransferase involved in cell wall biosynthesis
MRVAIITPTTGNPLLQRAVQSVQEQDWDGIEHFIVIDGKERENMAYSQLKKIYFEKKTTVLTLPTVTGHSGFLGHRIYAAVSYLLDCDYFIFLDEDNWFDPNHVSSLFESVCLPRLSWGYALRKIYDSSKCYVTRDDCESLGRWPSYLDDHDYHVDVNCYILKREVAVAISPLWYRQSRMPGIQDVDRAICARLLNTCPDFATNGLYSVNYTAGSTVQSVRPEFYIHGNQVMRKRFPDGYPWSRESQNN